MHTPHQVFDAQGQPQLLGNLLGQGGEGSIYMLQRNAGSLVKLYHAEKLKAQGKHLFAKVELMCANAASFKHITAKWPRHSVYDPNGNWIGFAMGRAAGVPMARLAHAMLYEKYYPGLCRIQLVWFLMHWLETLEKLHRQGVMIGDYNMNNVICNPAPQAMCPTSLIDCDSFQINLNGQIQLCTVGSPDMTPPEHHNRNFSGFQRTLSSEYFSAAIIIFKCLMLGRHPYDIIGGSDPVSNMVQGKFAYGKGNHGIPTGPWFCIWSHMPHRLKQMFISVFTEGAIKPANRPSLLDWLDALHLYRKEMKKNWHLSAIRPTSPKPQSYRGQNQAIIQSSAGMVCA